MAMASSLQNCQSSILSRSLNYSQPKFYLQSLYFRRKSEYFLVSDGIRISKKGAFLLSCLAKKMDSEIGEFREKEKEDVERPPFDINLAVILAGFAFEAYTTPPETIGKQEVDAADCKTVYLSGSFLREIYDGQLFMKLKKGLNLPAMDPWGTSDPYVIIQLNSQSAKSKTKWGTKEPTWNEEFTLNTKKSSNKKLQVAAWDANLITPPKRMGNAVIDLEGLYDGDSHDVLVELEGMGGGGKLQLEIKYKSFSDIDEEQKWWNIPFVSEFLRKNGFASAVKMVIGSESIPARQFVENAFAQMKMFNDNSLAMDWNFVGDDHEKKATITSPNPSTTTSLPSYIEKGDDSSSGDTNSNGEMKLEGITTENVGLTNGTSVKVDDQVSRPLESDKSFWNTFADVINQNVLKKLGFTVPEILKWDGSELLEKVGLQSQSMAEAGYVESGLATQLKDQNVNANDASNGTPATIQIQASLTDIQKATESVLKQTDSILGALVVLTAAVSQSSKVVEHEGKDKSKENSSSKTSDRALEVQNAETSKSLIDESGQDEKKVEEMKELFSTAESAMEAWAMLATSLGHPSFIKSEFEKLCFLDNPSTDTQLAIWRDSLQKRLVVAFRGTEQTRWKDLRTDLMLAPAGLNPERIGGDFKEEVQVHSGFLSAYDSIRTKLFSLIKSAIGYSDEYVEQEHKWHVYVTGHSLGGALATLLALELSSSQLVKKGAIKVTMYNFGSPRVGNKRFAEVYNEKVKDSWRIVNHRDIIPTVPRLMGYCHVAQPVYLATGDLSNALENMEQSVDDYQGDVIGESTPDVLVNEFMKGEKELIEKILQTEINIFRSIRDGSALMQHMEDFYYITLLENVKSNYQTALAPRTNREGESRVSKKAAEQKLKHI